MIGNIAGHPAVKDIDAIVQILKLVSDPNFHEHSVENFISKEKELADLQAQIDASHAELHTLEEIIATRKNELTEAEAAREADLVRRETAVATLGERLAKAETDNSWRENKVAARERAVSERESALNMQLKGLGYVPAPGA